MKTKFAQRLGLTPNPKQHPAIVNVDWIPNRTMKVTVVPNPEPEHTNGQRYPVHDDPRKGQVFEGECNVTACDSTHAYFWNIWTHGFYCPRCAKGINWREMICVPVSRKPTIEEQIQLQIPRPRHAPDQMELLAQMGLHP